MIRVLKPIRPIIVGCRLLGEPFLGLSFCKVRYGIVPAKNDPRTGGVIRQWRTGRNQESKDAKTHHQTAGKLNHWSAPHSNKRGIGLQSYSIRRIVAIGAFRKCTGHLFFLNSTELTCCGNVCRSVVGTKRTFEGGQSMSALPLYFRHQLVPLLPRRHRPRFLDIAPCSRSWYAQARAGRP
jgi:hypothetical protein